MFFDEKFNDISDEQRKKYMKDHRPLSHIPFICVGGIGPDTIEAFIKSGAKGVGTGISILKPELVESENYDEITNLTKLHIEKIQKARERKI